MELLKNNMNGDFERMKEKLSDLKGEKSYLTDKKKSLEQRINRLAQEKIDSEEARVFLQVVSEETLKNMEFHLSALPTFALFAIDPTFPKEIAEVTTRKDGIGCTFYFEEDGNKDKPLDSSGGGALGIGGLGNRIMLWSLDQNRPSFVLDEPLKDLSPDRHRNASELLKRLTDDLKIQIIMVSHQEEVHSKADKVFRVVRKGRVSIVEEA